MFDRCNCDECRERRAENFGKQWSIGQTVIAAVFIGYVLYYVVMALS